MLHTGLKHKQEHSATAEIVRSWIWVSKHFFLVLLRSEEIRAGAGICRSLMVNTFQLAENTGNGAGTDTSHKSAGDTSQK